MSLPTETQILIVGAGPTGLATALTLINLGLQVTVIDRASTNHNGSRASIVHSHTLEVLETIGMANEIIASGTKTDKVVFYGDTSKIFEFTLSLLQDETKFPFSVMIPQHEVEKVLRDRLESLGLTIFRNRNVVDVSQDDTTNGVKVTLEDGSVIRTRYLVGADGARSAIRRLSGIEFKDPHSGIAYDQKNSDTFQMILADAYLEDTLPFSIRRDRLSVYADKFIVLTPLPKDSSIITPGTSRWRISFGIPNGSDDIPSHPDVEYFQHIMDERNPWGVPVKFASITTSSRYKIRSAIADTYFKKLGEGNILLAGDAAHVHPPTGGQGMNLGICDGIALGHAIHGSINNKEPDLLQKYSDVRRSTGIKVIGFALGLTGLLRATDGWKRSLRNLTFRVLRHTPYVDRIGARRLSGLVNRMS